jgi:uncharacterized protein
MVDGDGFNWMAIGLALTGFIADAVANLTEVRNVIFGSGIIFFGLIISQLALVFITSSRIYRMPGGPRLLCLSYTRP